MEINDFTRVHVDFDFEIIACFDDMEDKKKHYWLKTNFYNLLFVIDLFSLIIIIIIMWGDLEIRIK